MVVVVKLRGDGGSYGWVGVSQVKRAGERASQAEQRPRGVE